RVTDLVLRFVRCEADFDGFVEASPGRLDRGGAHSMRFEGEPRAVQVAAPAAGRSVGNQHDAAGGDGVDPTAGPHAAVVLRLLVAVQVEVPQRPRAVDHHILRTGEDSAAVRAAERKRSLVAGGEIPRPALRVNGVVVDEGPRRIAGPLLPHYPTAGCLE